MIKVTFTLTVGSGVNKCESGSLNDQNFNRVLMHFHLKTVIEEEQCDIFTTVTWLISQSNGFYSVNEATMGGQQVGLERESTISSKKVKRKMVSAY